MMGEDDELEIDEVMALRRAHRKLEQDIDSKKTEMFRIQNILRRARLRRVQKSTPRDAITDHAIVRYLERFKGVDLNEIRDEIAARVRNGQRLCFERIDCGYFIAIVPEDTGMVATVYSTEMHKKTPCACQIGGRPCCKVAAESSPQGGDQ